MNINALLMDEQDNVVTCVAAVSTLFKEMGSRKWAWFSIAWQVGCAYAASLLVFQIGSLFL